MCSGVFVDNLKSGFTPTRLNISLGGSSMSLDFKLLGLLFLIGFPNAPMFTMKKISFTAIVLSIPILKEVGEDSERAHKDLSCLQLIDRPGCNVSHNMMQPKSLSCFATRSEYVNVS